MIVRGDQKNSSLGPLPACRPVEYYCSHYDLIGLTLAYHDDHQRALPSELDLSFDRRMKDEWRVANRGVGSNQIVHPLSGLFKKFVEASEESPICYLV